jgi:hypothetical protein
MAGSEYGLFLRQLDAGHLELALTYAADLGTVSLRDALRICELMARDSDVRFSKAAALGRLWEEPESELALATLGALVGVQPAK